MAYLHVQVGLLTDYRIPSDEFVAVFKKVVGHFGAVGDDVVDLEQWLDGTRWSEIQAKQAEIEKLEQDL